MLPVRSSARLRRIAADHTVNRTQGFICCLGRAPNARPDEYCACLGECNISGIELRMSRGPLEVF